MVQLTPEQLKRYIPRLTEEAEWAEAINAAAPQYGITSPMRIAAFLSQAGHESKNFTALVENLNYSAEALTRTWPKRFPPEVAQKYARDPEAIANRAYANRMGNGPEESGDGWKFRGHGLLQLTGKDTISDFADSIGKSVDDTLEYLQTKAGAVEAGCWFWRRNNLNALADQGKTEAITRIINGGTIGLDDRTIRYQLICRTMKNEGVLA